MTELDKLREELEKTTKQYSEFPDDLSYNRRQAAKQAFEAYKTCKEELRNTDVWK
jgi:hypothetical protein